MTKDNHLIVIHDHFLDGLTDVAKKFPNRHRKDGRYYVVDFTLKRFNHEMTENFSVENGKQVQVYLTVSLFGNLTSVFIPLKMN